MAEVDDNGDLGEALADDNVNEASSLRHRKGTSKAKLTLSAASRMLRRKIPQSGHLMIPRRLWMQTLPTQDCEAVIAFSPAVSEATFQFFLNILQSRLPEIAISVGNYQASKAYVLYATSTPIGLLKGGQELRLPKKTKAEYGNETREFCLGEMHIFQGVEEPSTFFTSQEKQSIVHHLLNSLRSVDGDEISGITFRPGQGIVPCLISEGLIQQVFPLHDHQYLMKLRKTWVQAFARFQPLDSIYEYFGAKIAIYFSWLGFYTASLIFPATTGFFFWIYLWGGDQAKEDKAFVVLAMLNVLWGSAWLEAWKRRSAEISYEWGVRSHPNELLEDPRPMFKGELGMSPVTDRVEPIFPTWKRNLIRYCVSLPLMGLWTLIVICVMFIMLEFQGWWDKVLERRGSPTFLSYGPKFAVAAIVSLFDELSTKVATRLTDLENYRGEGEHTSHLMVKVALLRLVNSFFVLFYIAFYLQDMDGLNGQLAALFLTRQIVGNIKESCIPYIMEQLKLAKLSFELFGALSPTEEAANDSDGNSFALPESVKGHFASNKDSSLIRTPSKTRIVGQAEIESNMSKYDDAFEDYLEMFIQFGYVMLFSSAFPLAAMCAFVNNLIEIRSDAFKLCCVFQRPFAKSATGIGVWQDMMELMGVLGIIVNCMLIGTSGQVHRMFPEMSTTQTILLIVVLEHFMIALKYAISYVIPSTPEWMSNQMARIEFQRRQTIGKLADSSASPTHENSEHYSPKSFSMTSMASTEYTERSVQTDITHIGVKKKSLNKIGRVESFAFPRDFRIPERKRSVETKIDEVEPKKEPLPTASTIKTDLPTNNYLDNSYLSHPEHFSRKPTPSESLPVLSAPAFNDRRSGLLSFSPERENILSRTSRPQPMNVDLSQPMYSSSATIHERSSSEEVGTDPETTLKETSTRGDFEISTSSLNESDKSCSAGDESLSSTSGLELHDEAASLVSDLPKFGKKHPVKFLKRAQSFSQVFKRITDKKKRPSDLLRDDYSLIMHREPLGELDLVNLDKLVALEDLGVNCEK